ncbi:MAG: hypothetical protein ACKVP7_15505 [Hyphomicrobiaceae bacterium]
MRELASQPTVLRTGGRFFEYLFGRNLLIGLASMMLLVISGYATWSGMNDFIIGASSASKGRELPGGFSVSHTHLVVAVTVALTFLMWISLREAIGKERKFTERLITFPLYIFLVLWSVGFGYGFWWSLIAGEEATRTGLSSLQEDARDAGAAVAARLDAVRAQIESVATWSDSQMTVEETRGGSCGVASGAGRGPLYNARRQVRDAVSSIRDSVTKSWITPVQIELDLLRKNAAGLEGDGAEDRQKRFEAMASQIRGSARNIASRSNELGKATASSMRGLADQVAIPPNTSGFTCHDPQLAQRLRQAAEQAAEPAKLQLREVVFNEGPAGVANAVKNLWTNMGSYFANLARYVFTGGKSSGDHTSSGEPITGRDMIALLATIGIDLGLFVLALLDRPAAFQRRDGLEDNTARLHLPSKDVVRQLAAAFQTAIGRAQDRDIEWVRQHFIHHNGASYFVTPNLYGVVKDGPNSKKEEKWALALNQLAGVMEDVKLVRTVSAKELEAFLKDESRGSLSDLSAARKAWREKNNKGGDNKDLAPIRNHGLLSKAERALDIAGWSEESKRDIEVYRIVDVDGLTPLLSLLSDTSIERELKATPAVSAAALPDNKPPLALENKGRA